MKKHNAYETVNNFNRSQYAQNKNGVWFFRIREATRNGYGPHRWGKWELTYQPAAQQIPNKPGRYKPITLKTESIPA